MDPQSQGSSHQFRFRSHLLIKAKLVAYAVAVLYLQLSHLNSFLVVLLRIHQFSSQGHHHLLIILTLFFRSKFLFCFFHNSCADFVSTLLNRRLQREVCSVRSFCKVFGTRLKVGVEPSFNNVFTKDFRSIV